MYTYHVHEHPVLLRRTEADNAVQMLVGVDATPSDTIIAYQWAQVGSLGAYRVRTRPGGE
jgi:hypothetical protein